MEVRAEVDGVVDVRVIGRLPAAPNGGQSDVAIPFRSHLTSVYKNEVFDGAEAAEIFFHYFKNNEVAGNYTLRPLGFVEQF